jgi:low temperature requirement protein LtrA
VVELLARYIKCAYTHPEHREYLKRIIMHTTASALIFAASMLTPTDDDLRLYLIIWFIGILVERPLMHVIACASPDTSPPLVLKKHIGHLVSRQGTFFMLILGEAVIQLVQAHGGYDFPSYVRALLGFAVVFNVGNVYYEQQQREPTRHVLVRSATLGYIWVELQSVLSMFVLFFAVGVKVVFHSFDEYQEMRDEFLMCGFASVSLLLMYTMSLMHRGFDFNFHGTPRRLFYHVFFYTAAIGCAMIPLFATSTTICIVILHILTSAIVVQDIASRTLRIHELSSIVKLSEKDASRAWASAMDTSINSDIYNYGRDGIDSSTSSRIGLTTEEAIPNNSSGRR